MLYHFGLLIMYLFWRKVKKGNLKYVSYRCGHCQKLVPEYTKLANAVKGIVKVGAVDMTKYQSVGAPYNVQGFPTIKIFGADKKTPVEYQG